VSPEVVAGLWTGLGAVAGSAIATIGNYLTRRSTSPSKAASDFSTITAGFRELVGEIQDERRRLADEASELVKKVDELKEIVDQLSGHIDKLEDTIRSHGMTPPLRPARLLRRP